MKNAIQSVDMVSDGLLVQFTGGLCCYFPADFLLEHTQNGSNQIFLNYDPSPGSDAYETNFIDNARLSLVESPAPIC